MATDRFRFYQSDATLRSETLKTKVNLKRLMFILRGESSVNTGNIPSPVKQTKRLSPPVHFHESIRSRLSTVRGTCVDQTLREENTVMYSWMSSRIPSNFLFGMRGLTNYGLSCCVNTLLQTLSATWELADLLDKWEASCQRREDAHNVPLQLKRVLTAMRSDLPQPAPHQDFLRCLDRNCVRLNMQHDADEVFLAIMNFIQKQMDDKALALEIQNLYKIDLETQVQCLECTSIQTHNSYMLSLPLHIKEDHNTLEGCFSSFFEHHELRGIDCCYCPQCGKKTPSKQGVKLLSLPRILCVHLKRFRNSRGDIRKLDCMVTFPETFDFSENLQEAFHSEFAQNDCKYTLHAVVVHSGYASSGHYTAYVRNRANQSWYYANDSHVEKTSWDNVKTTYGGNYRHTAYMLMYRRGPGDGRQQPQLSG